MSFIQSFLHPLRKHGKVETELAQFRSKLEIIEEEIDKTQNKAKFETEEDDLDPFQA